MSARIFDGKVVADKIIAKLKNEVAQMNEQPRLAIVAIVPDSSTISYLRAKQKRAAEVGIELELHEIKQASQSEAELLIGQLAANPLIHGLMIQLPLPPTLDQSALIRLIPPEKDVDGLRFVDLPIPVFAPAAVMAVLAALDDSGIRPRHDTTKKVVIVGQGGVGLPLAKILQGSGLPVETADEHTKDLANLTAKADVLISAVGKANLISAEMVKAGAVVIDVGVSIQDGQQVGDIQFETVASKAAFVTPPRSGIGPLTIACLMQNVVTAALNQSQTTK